MPYQLIPVFLFSAAADLWFLSQQRYSSEAAWKPSADYPQPLSRAALLEIKTAQLSAQLTATVRYVL